MHVCMCLCMYVCMYTLYQTTGYYKKVAQLLDTPIVESQADCTQCEMLLHFMLSWSQIDCILILHCIHVCPVLVQTPPSLHSEGWDLAVRD